MRSERDVGANYPNFPESFFEMQVKMQVGQNAYEADVLTAIKTDQREIFYDVVGIQPANNKTLSRTQHGIQRFGEQRVGDLGRSLPVVPT